MKAIVNQLIQLQELLLIREEQKAAGIKQHIDKLDESINTMISKLPPDIHSLFERLYKKSPTVIIPVAGDLCSHCGIKLPTALIQAIKLQKELCSCPNCAHILYYPEFAARRKPEKPRRDFTGLPGIARFSSESLMIPNLSATNTEEALRELATKMEKEGYIEHAEILVSAAIERENILSTYVGHGIAFPHVRGVEGGALTFALGLSQKGIKWNNTNDKVHIVFLITIPIIASVFYLKLLAGLSETFSKAEARHALLSERTPQDMWKTLIKLTRKTIK